MRRSTPVVASALALASAFACTEAIDTQISGADDVAYVGALELDGARILSGSELRAWPKGQGFPFVARAHADTVLAGFSAASLIAQGVIDADGAPIPGFLRAPMPCEPQLPPAIWAARWPADATLQTADAAIVPLLTTDVLATSCPSFDPNDIRVQIDCRDRFCAPAVRVVEQCAIEVDLSACGDRVIAARAIPPDRVCLDRTAAEIATCAIDAAFLGETQPFELATRRVVEGASEVVPDFLRSNGLLIPDTLFFGWAYDLTIAGDTVLIAAGDGLAARDVCRGAADLHGRLIALDANTMEPMNPMNPIPAPPCLTRIAAIPGREEFIGVYAENQNYVLGRFDLAGNMIGHSEIQAELATERLVDLEILPAANAIAMLFNVATEDGKTGDGGNILAVHALDTLAPKSRTVFVSGQRWAMAAGGEPGGLAIADHRHRRIEWLNIDTGTVAAALDLRRNVDLMDDALLDIVFDAPSAQFFAQSVRDDLVFLLGWKGPLIDADYFYEREVQPVTAVSWPLGQGLMLVSGMIRDGTSLRANVALYDVTRRRFQPGTFDIGWGATNKLASDRMGRVWALLPWSGDVVRMTPKP